MSLEDQQGISALFEKYSPEVVINLALKRSSRLFTENPYCMFEVT